MSEDYTYTPTTDQVREDYSITVIDGSVLPERADAFERWLAAHDREAKAAALREAADEVHISCGDYFDDLGNHRYGAHVRTIIDPDSKPFPTARTVSVADWLRERITRGEQA